MINKQQMRLEELFTGLRFSVRCSHGFPECPKHKNMAMVQERILGKGDFMAGYWRDPISQALYIQTM